MFFYRVTLLYTSPFCFINTFFLFLATENVFESVSCVHNKYVTKFCTQPIPKHKFTCLFGPETSGGFLTLINPRRACAARVTVVGSVFLCVC